MSALYKDSQWTHVLSCLCRTLKLRDYHSRYEDHHDHAARKLQFLY